MSDKENIQDKLSRELHKLQEQDLNPVPIRIISEIVNILKSIDTDMNYLLDIFLYLMENETDESIRTVAFYRLLKFYGLVGKIDILSARQKFVTVKGSNTLKKTPFLKRKDKECINIILKDKGII